MKYNYIIQNVIPSEGFMEICFSMEGKEDILVGGRLPNKGESLNEVVSSYAPINLWFPKEKKYDIIEEGTVGEISTIDPRTVIHRDQVLQDIYSNAPRVSKKLLSKINDIDIKHLNLLPWYNFENDIVAFEVVAPQGGPDKIQNPKAGFISMMGFFKLIKTMNNYGVPIFAPTTEDNVVINGVKNNNAMIKDLKYEKLLYIPYDDKLKEAREKTEIVIIKEIRNKLLSETDWIFCSDINIDIEPWKKYRQELRDVPQQAEFPNKIIWPKKPI